MTIHDLSAAPRLGGKLVVSIFIFTLLAFVVESQLAQYVQTTLGYRQPFFIFYIVHSSFLVIFPLHLVFLVSTTRHSAAALISGVKLALARHLSSPGSSHVFPRKKFLILTLCLTAGVTLPGLLWFAAVTLSSLSDVTAIWNTNAFFAYLISVKALGLQWQARRLGAVLLATIGVLVMVYGGSQAPIKEDTSIAALPIPRPSAPLVGDLLTLAASVIYALYQVLYKKYVALPSDPELASETAYEHVSSTDDDPVFAQDDDPDSRNCVYPPPFGFHPNLLTSIVGLLTLIFLWIPIPILHFSGAELFTLPPSWRATFAIAGIALGGVVFNGGFMILLGVWGPIITSVGGLLTIVLVFISDLIFGIGISALTLWSVVGTIAVVTAFAVLASDIFYKREARAV